MRGRWIWFGLLLFVAPILLRGLWYYRGRYNPPTEIQAPDYVSLLPPTPPFREEEASESVELEGEESGPVVLIDMSHDNSFSLGELDSLTDALQEEGADLEILGEFDYSGPPLEERLKYAQAYITIAPLTTFATSEIQNLVDFVESGGRILAISDPTRTSTFYDPFGFGGGPGSDIASLNGLLSPFDLTFNDDYLYNLLEYEGNYRNVYFESFGDHPVTEDLERLAFYASRSVATREGTPLLLGGEGTVSTLEGGDLVLAAGAAGSNPGVIALGDLTFMTSPYNRVLDNRQFIEQLARYLLAGERQITLEDFPYIFTQDLGVLTSESFPLTPENLEVMTAFQGLSNSLGLELTLVKEAEEGQDLIVLGTYEDESLEGYAEVLGIVLPTQSEEGLMELPGLEGVDPTGFGLVLLYEEGGRRTLILVANDEEELRSLALQVAASDFFGCMFMESFALCQVGEGVGFGGDFDFDFDFDFEDFPTPGPGDGDLVTPTPPPVPTPSG